MVPTRPSVKASIVAPSNWLLLIVAVVCGCNTSNNSAKGDSSKRATEIAELVEGLASRNVTPNITDGPFSSKVTLPPSFDKSEQNRVYECYKSLLNREAEAFPAFISHLDDDRYSQTGLVIGEESILRSYSIGVACKTALRLQLDEPYLTHVHVYGPQDYFHRFSYVDSVVGSGGKARVWADQHSGKSLAEIQCEAIEWFLSAMADFGNTGPTADEIAEVHALLQTIRKTNNPIRLDDPTMKPRYNSIYEDGAVSRGVSVKEK
jgi:hypothetical protein